MRDWECIVFFFARDLLSIVIVRSDFDCDPVGIQLWFRPRSGWNPAMISTMIWPKFSCDFDHDLARTRLRFDRNPTAILLEFNRDLVGIQPWSDRNWSPTRSWLESDHIAAASIATTGGRDPVKIWPRSDDANAPRPPQDIGGGYSMADDRRSYNDVIVYSQLLYILIY